MENLLNVYQEDSVSKKVLLEFPDMILTAEDITESMSFSETVNPGNDCMVGATSAAQLDFEIINLNQLVTDEQIKKEFRFRHGIQTMERSFYTLYQAIGADLLCPGQSLAYAASGTKLEIWRTGETPRKLSAPEQPAQQIESLFLIEDRLYCGHAAAPWLTAYLVQGETLVKTGTPSLTPFQIEQIKRRNNVESVLVLIAGQMKTYEKKRYDLKLIDYIERTYTFTLVGYFTCDEPERVDENTIRMQCYDRMVKFQDTLVDDFVTSLGYPIRLGELLNRLCTLVSVPLGTQAIFNSDYQVKKNFRASNMSARQLLQLIAEIACCFAVISPSGTLELRWYTDLDYLIKEDYTNLRTADYVVQKIDKLQVRSTENDVGVIVGTGKNQYTIENNSLLYADTDAELRPVAEKIYNRIKDFSYIPYEITTKGNYLIRAGMAVQIEGVKGTRIRGLVMSRRMTGVMALSDTYRATGNRQREVQSSLVNQQIQRLRGRTNELVMTLEETKNTLTTVESDMETVKTTVGELKLTSEQFNVTLTETKELLEGTDGKPGLVQRMASMELSLDGFNVILQGTNENPGLVQKVASLELSLDGFFVSLDEAGIKFTKEGLEIGYQSDDEHMDKVVFKDGKQMFYHGDREVFSIAPEGYTWVRFSGTVVNLSVGTLRFVNLYEFEPIDNNEQRVNKKLVKDVKGDTFWALGTENISPF